MLKTLLHAKNVETFPALIATTHYCQPLDQYPNLDSFNHMILATATPKGGYRFLDGTNTWADANDSYFPLIGRTAFLIRPDGSRLVQVPAGDNFQNRVITHAQVKEEDQDAPLKIKGSIQLIGNPALEFFSDLNWSETTEQNSLAKRFLQQKFGIYPLSVQYSAPDGSRVTFNYEALFQENYVAMGKGGFRLAVPRLFGMAVDDTLDQNKGPRQIMRFEQQDTWEFRQQLKTSRFIDFHLPFADCDYALNGNTIARQYRQKEKIFSDGDDLLDTWMKQIKTTLSSTCWR